MIKKILCERNMKKDIEIKERKKGKKVIIFFCNKISWDYYF